MTREQIIERVKNAGIVGCGGAGFPAHLKLTAECDIVIANGAECEPLLHCDQETMRLRPEEVIGGLQLAMQAVGARKGVIALKHKYERSIAALQTHLPDEMELFELGNYYPSGDEHVLVYEVTGRVVPEGGIPPEVRVLVQNVGTLVQIFHAVSKGLPVTKRWVTIAGEVAEPGTYELPIGLPVEKALQVAGGATVDDFAVVEGGPMMGIDADPLTDVVKKTTTGLIVLDEQHAYIRMRHIKWEDRLRQAAVSCEQCRFCTDFCPRYLLGHRLYPDQVMKAVGWNTVLNDEHILGAQLCIECGLCGIFWACPNKLSPDHYNARLKREFRERNIKAGLYKSDPVPHEMREGRRVPVDKLTQRLSLTEYLGQGEFKKNGQSFGLVKIPLDGHIGVPAEPVVREGQQVKQGDVIATIEGGKTGAPVHASIDGTVKSISGNKILIAAE